MSRILSAKWWSASLAPASSQRGCERGVGEGQCRVSWGDALSVCLQRNAGVSVDGTGICFSALTDEDIETCEGLASTADVNWKGLEFSMAFMALANV